MENKSVVDCRQPFHIVDGKIISAEHNLEYVHSQEGNGWVCVTSGCEYFEPDTTGHNGG
jgi:hypothetical protein